MSAREYESIRNIKRTKPLAARALQGYKRCVWNHHAHDSSPDPERRVYAKQKNQRCRNWVSPEHIRERGGAVCAVHLPLLLKAMVTAGERRATLRAKLDPGPVRI